MDLYKRHHVVQSGRGTQPMVFAHGFGCDQHMWRFVAPAFEGAFRVILFDHAGCGEADPMAYEPKRHQELKGYVRDVLDICAELELKRVIYVGHSVSAMIGVLAAIERPELFDRLVLIGPSPSYINDGDYHGGFTRSDIDALLDSLDTNYLGWASAMAPVIMGNPERPELAEELTNRFCRNDPEIAKRFAQVTFLSDNRDDLSRVKVPALVLQCSHDVIAPVSVGEYVHRHLAKSELVMLKATGHCPNLSAPAETIAAIRAYLGVGAR